MVTATDISSQSSRADPAADRAVALWLLACCAMIFAMVVPNDFSPPIASTGIVSFPLARNCWLSIASWSNAANCMKPECMAPGSA